MTRLRESQAGLTRLRESQAGLTLIETMVAMLIFALVTVGITPLLLSSIRGSSTSRSYTMGKNLALDTMERIRGLPYFASMNGLTNPKRRDVLDLYYPDLGSGYASSKFTTTCTTTTQTPAASGPSACPLKLANGTTALPTGYTIKIEAEFVKPGAISGGQQTFTVVTPPAGYSWAALATETPPAQLVRITVTSSWTMTGKSRQFTLTSLIGEKSLSPDKVSGSASIDYAVQAVTSYLGDDGRISTLTATEGKSVSRIETKAVSAADQDIRAARLTLATEQFNGAPGSVLQDLVGAGNLLHAPPDTFYAANQTGVAQTATYQTNPSAPVTSIAFTTPTNVTNAGVKVVDELPRAEGNFSFTGADLAFWVDNQADTGSRTDLLLHGTRNIFTIRRDVLGMSGFTKTEATALTPTSSRKVESTVNIKVGRIDLFPTTYISVEQRAVIVITNFQVDLKCTSTANAGTASVTGSWSAKLKYWRDLTNNGVDDGSYTTDLTIGGALSGGTEALESIQTANPLVYDAANNTKDIYLFVDTAAAKRGYLQDWSMKPSITWSKDASGRSTTATLSGAMQMITNNTNPLIAASALNITLGKVSCTAVDQR